MINKKYVGSLIKMSNGKEVRTFWLFVDGCAIEYVKGGRKQIEDFTKLFIELSSIGYVEI